MSLSPEKTPTLPPEPPYPVGASGSEANAYGGPSFSVGNRAARLLWGLAYTLLFRSSPRPCHAWRAFLLRCFGARMGTACHIYPKAIIWAPWNLVCEDKAAVADGAIIYNPSPIHLGSHSIVSQEAYLCGATHDYEDPNFPLISAPIRLESYSWICARATVQMGVTVREGAVLALGAVATKDLEPWMVYAGVPARQLKPRRHPLRPAALDAPEISLLTHRSQDALSTP